MAVVDDGTAESDVSIDGTRKIATITLAAVPAYRIALGDEKISLSLLPAALLVTPVADVDVLVDDAGGVVTITNERKLYGYFVLFSASAQNPKGALHTTHNSRPQIHVRHPCL